MELLEQTEYLHIRKNFSKTPKEQEALFLFEKIRQVEVDNKFKNIRDIYRDVSSRRIGFQANINIVRDDECNLTATPVQEESLEDEENTVK